MGPYGALGAHCGTGRLGPLVLWHESDGAAPLVTVEQTVVAAKQARKDPLGQATVARLADWLMEAKVG